MKNIQSWVETTLPPGYAVEEPGPCKGEDTWSFGFIEMRDGVAEIRLRYGFISQTEACRAAWRHWTAAVLRGRGNLRADNVEKYAQSGAIVWSWRGNKVGFKRMYVRWRHSNPDIYELGPHDARGEDVYDLDEAMARFAMYVFYCLGPARKSS